MRVELRQSDPGGERPVAVAHLAPTIGELRRLCARHGLVLAHVRFERGGLSVIAVPRPAPLLAPLPPA